MNAKRRKRAPKPFPHTGGRGIELGRVLRERQGTATTLRLADGAEITAFGTTDCGANPMDDCEWVRIEIATAPHEIPDHELYMSDVEALVDPETGAILRRQTPDPDATPEGPPIRLEQVKGGIRGIWTR